MKTWEKIFSFIFCPMMIIGFISTGIYYSTQISKDERNYTTNATIILGVCMEDCLWGCDRYMRLVLGYTYEGQYYNSTFASEVTLRCDIPAYHGNWGPCCENLYGTEVWIDISTSNPYHIYQMGTKETYNIGNNIMYTLLFFGASSICLCYMLTYIPYIRDNFPNIKNIKFTNTDYDQIN